MKEEEIKKENFKLGRRPQEQQVWKGPAEPLGYFPCQHLPMVMFTHHTVLALLCFLQPSRTFPSQLLKLCLLVCSQKPSVVNSKHANWTGFKNKSLQMSSIHYCYNCKLLFSRKINLNSQGCGHFFCCTTCQPDGTRQDRSHQANEKC